MLYEIGCIIDRTLSAIQITGNVILVGIACSPFLWMAYQGAINVMALPKARAVHVEVVKVYAAWRRGDLPERSQPSAEAPALDMLAKAVFMLAENQKQFQDILVGLVKPAKTLPLPTSLAQSLAASPRRARKMRLTFDPLEVAFRVLCRLPPPLPEAGPVPS